MEKLSKIFPYVIALFTINKDKGISMSQAQRDKEKNKNENEKLLEKLTYKDSKIYNKEREVISDSQCKESLIEGDLISVSDFDILPHIAENNKLSSIYGNGIKVKNNLLDSVSKLSVEEIAKHFQIELPVFTGKPIEKKTASTKPIDYYSSLERVEELFEHAKAELIEKIGKFYFEGLEIEAKAAAYGKQVTEKDSIIRRISKAEKRGTTVSDKTNTILVYDTQVLGINKEEFAKLETELMEKYEKFQMERNSIMKQIKDIARELQRQYDVEYSTALTQYNQEYDSYNQKLRVAYSLCETIKTELLQEVAQLKIKVA